ncbi:PVC-type heme-binding CxxCH protein [Adhaeretor mobilis]|uniref:Cytochrome c n=1 Tax=Adhaeretor mobilis TaxID=1930276 RepID=A0A517MUA2_9BACT|nr:PVC-type heme-binding CxxCH protein [Adhaeretor mobilis]QDS98463.1 Cytochrome c [Adhaeretor mobilis]
MKFGMRLIAFLLLASTVMADDLPKGVENSQNPNDVSLSPQDSLSRITVPEGFHVTLFAGEPDIRRPIAFDFDDRGRLWVVENYSHPHWKEENATDRVIILEDTDHDGEFDKRKVFWDQGRYLTGIALGHGGVWLANTPELLFIPDRDKDDIPDGDPVVMLDGFQISTNNVLNNFHWGPDGWLYGAIGLSTQSLVGEPNTPKEQRTPITRGIWRFHPISHRFEKVAEGMVNPWGADFNEFGDLFTANTVIAHLWHIVPGMYCERRAAERDNPFAYSRIQSVTNHLHWGGGTWQSSRNLSSHKIKKQANSATVEAAAVVNHDHDEGYHSHSVSGGGHAHCGAMIYLGDNWPEKYHGTFFTNNLHGNRVNNDRLIPKRSTYVGEHDDDFLFGNDPWFRGMSIKYGPDGGVYVSDWHDYGECHDSDGSHRTTGRIYKVTYGDPQRKTINLQKKSNLELAELVSHPNEWFVRRARRILHERHIRGVDVADARDQLISVVQSDADELHRLRALWALHPLDQQQLCEVLLRKGDDSEHIRRWALRLVTDRSNCDTSFSDGVTRNWIPSHYLEQLSSSADSDPSAKVRLELASALQRLDPAHRLDLASRLLNHAEDATDPYLPLMIWYGLEPAVEKHLAEALKVALDSRIPLVRKYIARRIADIQPPPLEDIVRATLSTDDEQIAADLLKGMNESLASRGSQQEPKSWKKLYAQLTKADSDELRSVGVQLAVLFGDQDVISNMRQVVIDKSGNVAERCSAFRSLLKIDNGLSIDLLHDLVKTDSDLRKYALEALLANSDRTTAQILLQQFSTLSAEEKRSAVAVLVTRRQFAAALLRAISNGVVSRSDVSAFALQQLRNFSDSDIQQRVVGIWADDDTSVLKADEIIRLKEVMSADYLRSGDVAAGRTLFDRTCSKCHTLFGEGGTIAPDLTGSGRKSADYVIRNLIDPSEEIDATYRQTIVVTVDGRLFSGFIVQQDDHRITVRTQDTTVKLDMKDVDEVFTSNVSMMPDGMLNTLTDEQFRDLLAYLASEEQVAPQVVNPTR